MFLCVCVSRIFVCHFVVFVCVCVFLFVSFALSLCLSFFGSWDRLQAPAALAVLLLLPTVFPQTAFAVGVLTVLVRAPVRGDTVPRSKSSYFPCDHSYFMKNHILFPQPERPLFFWMTPLR